MLSGPLVARRRHTLAFALVLLTPLASDSAPATFYGLNLPDPLQVYSLQELKPENIRNDPFLVVFKTHITSLRPYEIPYFPPKDRLSAVEVDDDNVVASNAEEIKEVKPTDSDTTNESQAVSGGPNKENHSEKFNIDNIPELVELKPEVLLEALDASKQDAEEGQTSSPPNTAELLSDANDDIQKSDESDKDEATLAPTNSKKDDNFQNSERKAEELQKDSSGKESSLNPQHDKKEILKEENTEKNGKKEVTEQNTKEEFTQEDKDDF